MVVVRLDIGKDLNARNRDELVEIRVCHAVDHRADAVVHDKLIGDLLDRSDDLNALAALVGDEQKVRDLLKHAAVDLLDTGFAVDNNIIKLAGEHRDNVLQIGIDAAVAAFTKGEVWLDELRAYISENKRVATSYIQEKIPELTVILSDATYLLWVNCEEVSQNAKELVQKIREKTGLYLSDGNVFGGDGKHFFRMNLACPRERMMDGLKRLSQAITQIK